MRRTRVAVLTVVFAAVMTGFAAAISAATARVQSPGSLLVGLPQGPQVRESLRSPAPALGRSKEIKEESYPAVSGGRVRVVIESDTPSKARAAIEAVGGTVERSWRELVQAEVPSNSVAALDRQRSVDSVRAPYRHVEYAVSGEEVAASLAPAWHAKGFTGKGVKVAVIDAGFVGLAERQAAGEVPASAVTQDFCGGRLNTESEHGTAVAEIVHEIAVSDPDLYAQWMTAPTTVRFPDCESYSDLQSRVDAGIAALLERHNDGLVVVVTHGGVVRAVLRSVLDFPAERIFRLSIDPASVTTLEWLDGEPVVQAVNRRV